MKRILATAVFAALFLFASTVSAQWRTLHTIDDETGEPLTMARANGLEGHLSLLVMCERSYYMMALGFDDHGKIGDVIHMSWDDSPMERHYLYPEDDDEVVYLTTWPGEGTPARYDAEALAVFQKFRRHKTWTVKVTRLPNREVTERFNLAGAAKALDDLKCPHD